MSNFIQSPSLQKIRTVYGWSRTSINFFGKYSRNILPCSPEHSQWHIAGYEADETLDASRTEDVDHALARRVHTFRWPQVRRTGSPTPPDVWAPRQSTVEHRSSCPRANAYAFRPSTGEQPVFRFCCRRRRRRFHRPARTRFRDNVARDNAVRFATVVLCQKYEFKPSAGTAVPRTCTVVIPERGTGNRPRLYTGCRARTGRDFRENVRLRPRPNYGRQRQTMSGTRRSVSRRVIRVLPTGQVHDWRPAAGFPSAATGQQCPICRGILTVGLLTKCLFFILCSPVTSRQHRNESFPIPRTARRRLTSGNRSNAVSSPPSTTTTNRWPTCSSP